MRHGTVKVAELNAELSAYLRPANAGETIVILDRDTPVAELRQAIGKDGGGVSSAKGVQPSSVRRSGSLLARRAPFAIAKGRLAIAGRGRRSAEGVGF